jgi:hypothetical protein
VRDDLAMGRLVERYMGRLVEERAVDDKTIPGRFLITGSANVLANKKILDALPDRIDRFMLWPLAQAEIESGRVNFVDALLAGKPPQVTDARVRWADYAHRIVAGGFPEARERAPGRSRSRWFDGTSPDRWSTICTSWLTCAAPTTQSICCDCSRPRQPFRSRSARSPASLLWTTRRSAATSDS